MTTTSKPSIICPECGADSLIHVRVPESDVVVEQCDECGWADA